MDTAHPIRAVVPTLDGQVLEVLARTTRLLTGLDVHRIVSRASRSGVRKVLARLVDQGLVHAEKHGAALLYAANRHHLAWPAVEILAGIRRRLLDALVGEFRNWELSPIHASLFGSVARGEGDSESDIDILVIRPNGTDEDEPPWADQVVDLRRKVHSWTGNHCQIFQIDMDRLAEHVKAGDPLVQEWLRDSIALAGSNLKVLLRQLAAGSDQ